jgi:hypothetical protein
LRGATGVILAATLRAVRVPTGRAFVGWGFADGAGALAVARRALAAGARPADLALVDRKLVPAPAQAPLGAAQTLLAAHLDGVPEMVRAEEALFAELARAEGGVSVGAAAAERALATPGDGLGETFVPFGALAARWAARVGASALVGVHPAGAALRSASVAAPAAPLAPPLTVALVRALDPGARLAAAHALTSAD